jgi:hypothetical protein
LCIADGTSILTGTVEEVHEQLVRVNPSYDNDFSSHDAVALEKRTDFGGSSYNCNSNEWGFPKTRALKAGIRHLRGVKGEPSNGPGPGKIQSSRNLDSDLTTGRVRQLW